MSKIREYETKLTEVLTEAELTHKVTQLRGLLEYIGLGSWADKDGKHLSVGTGTKELLSAEESTAFPQNYTVKTPRFWEVE